MKKFLSLVTILLFFPALVFADNKEKQFNIGEGVFRFEQPQSYYSTSTEPIVWKKLYFVRGGQKLELFKGQETVFDLIEPDNISKDGSYFMITYLRSGYASGDRQYCALVNTSSGCVINNDSWLPVCDGEWSMTDGSVWIYNAGTVNAPQIVNWNLDDAIRAMRTGNNDEESLSGELNTKLCSANIFTNNTLDYDGDGLSDKINEETVDNQLHLSMWLSSVNKEFTYIINPVDENKIPVTHKSFNAGEMELDSSYFSRQGAIYSEVYKWDINNEHWNLINVINGERSDPWAGIFTPSLQVSRIECCVILGSNASYKEKSAETTQIEVNDELCQIQQLINKKEIAQAITYVNPYSASEYADALTKDNLVLLNDLAFYAAEHDNIASAIILERIVQQYPERVVAKLNLADVYWELGKDVGQLEAAKQLYIEYKSMMLARGLENKIPSRVFTRSNPNP